MTQEKEYVAAPYVVIQEHAVPQEKLFSMYHQSLQRIRRSAQMQGLSGEETEALMAAIENTWPLLRTPTPDPRKIFNVQPLPPKGVGQRALAEVQVEEDARACAALDAPGPDPEERP